MGRAGIKAIDDQLDTYEITFSSPLASSDIVVVSANNATRHTVSSVIGGGRLLITPYNTAFEEYRLADANFVVYRP